MSHPDTICIIVDVQSAPHITRHGVRSSTNILVCENKVTSLKVYGYSDSIRLEREILIAKHDFFSF